MPTYSYACTDCGNRFDAVQAFTDDTLTSCPQCEGRLRKLFNSVGVVFKGTGFYRNDSRATNTSSEGASSRSESKSDSGPSKDSAGSGGTPTSTSTTTAAPKPAKASTPASAGTSS